MSKFQEKRPRSFTEFVAFVEAIQKKRTKSLWYRGCSDSNYRLIPRLYRHRKRTQVNELTELEYQLMTRFRQRSIPFHNKSLENDWESLFFMQHYGVPTRLLDWTENPFIALYFAVMSSSPVYKKNRVTYKKSAAVWILDPVCWNRHALKHESYDQGILSTTDEQIKGYKPTARFTNMNDLPVALYGAHNSQRIVAQRGVFVIFGKNKSTMEKIFDLQNFPENCLTKVTLDKEVLPSIRRSILNHGITESVVFPDLEGLAKEIRRTFEFEV
jgi:hypothetical protein